LFSVAAYNDGQHFSIRTKISVESFLFLFILFIFLCVLLMLALVFPLRSSADGV